MRPAADHRHLPPVREGERLARCKYDAPVDFGGPAGTTTTITQFLYTYGIKSLDFGFGSAGAIVMTLLVLILSSFYIKRAMG